MHIIFPRLGNGPKNFLEFFQNLKYLFSLAKEKMYILYHTGLEIYLNINFKFIWKIDLRIFEL
tara:strand:+ start:1441 stop:1629 length:189 start_codon:yes stop_codon:yes gene_type:complete